MHTVKFKAFYSLSRASEKAEDIPLSLRLSPVGYLHVDSITDEKLPQTIAEKINSSFSAGESIGLSRNSEYQKIAKI